jgi:hypothetical protein
MRMEITLTLRNNLKEDRGGRDKRTVNSTTVRKFQYEVYMDH